MADRPGAASAADPADTYLEVDGARLRIRDQGHGPAVLLLHGWTLDLEMWSPQVAALSAAFRVVSVDRRGFGLSTGRPSLEGDVGDIDSICRRLMLAPVALVGMSQGARAVVEFAASAPARVACIVLDGSPELDSDATAEADVPVERYRQLLMTQGIRAFRREWAAHPLAQLRTPQPATRRLLEAMLERYPGTDLLEPGSGPPPAAKPPRLEALDLPALVISGEFDLPSRIAAAERIAIRLPRAERAVIPAAGHLPNLDNPEAYVRVLSAFIRRHTAAAT